MLTDDESCANSLQFTSETNALANRPLDFQKQDSKHVDTRCSKRQFDYGSIPPVKKHKSASSSRTDDTRTIATYQSLNPSIIEYQRYLLALYAHEEIPPDDKLSQSFLLSPCKKYVHLAIIKHYDSSFGLDIDEYTKGTLHGAVNKVSEKEELITFAELFSVNSDDSRSLKGQCFFVQGPSGIGKSTFARELCHEWHYANSILRDSFDIVLLLKLRDKWVQNTKKLSQLFDHHDEKLSELVAKAIENGDRVLIIFDGFDEYPSSPFNPFIEKIMKGIYLPNATLLVTSRPTARDRFRKLCTNIIIKEIEILGFTESDRMNFAENVFCFDMLQRFKDYCCSNPVIMSMMYIPLNCAIVTQICKEYWEHDVSDLLPKTMTQLYTTLCWTLIRRYMTQSGIECHNLQPGNFRDLPSVILCRFSELAKLAFEKLKYNEFVFTLPDGENFDHMRFMNFSGKAPSPQEAIAHTTFCT